MDALKFARRTGARGSLRRRDRRGGAAGGQSGWTNAPLMDPFGGVMQVLGSS